LAASSRQPQQLFAAGLGIGDAVEPALQLQELAAALPPVQPDLLQGHPDPMTHLGGVGPYIDARHRGLTITDRQQGAQHPYGRGLAGAVGAEKSEDLAATDGEVDSAHRLDVVLTSAAAVALDEPAHLDRESVRVLAAHGFLPHQHPRGDAGGQLLATV
jgi:hypothetical protein